MDKKELISFIKRKYNADKNRAVKSAIKLYDYMASHKQNEEINGLEVYKIDDKLYSCVYYSYGVGEAHFIPFDSRHGLSIKKITFYE